MATAAVTNQFTASTTIVSDDVDTNFADLVSFLNGSVLHLDGAKAMTGDLDMGAQDINNVPWKTWSPSYANLTVGNGTVAARYIRVGDIVIARFRFDLGSTSSIGLAPSVSTPVTAQAASAAGPPTGNAYLRDDGAAVNYAAYGHLLTTATFGLFVLATAAAHGTFVNVSATVPFTWATSDVLAFTAIYEAA